MLQNSLNGLDSLCICMAITCISLRAAVNLLVMGKAPNNISAYIAGAVLTVLNKSNPGHVQPIVVGEALCWLKIYYSVQQ